MVWTKNKTTNAFSSSLWSTSNKARSKVHPWRCLAAGANCTSVTWPEAALTSLLSREEALLPKKKSAAMTCEREEAASRAS